MNLSNDINISMIFPSSAAPRQQHHQQHQRKEYHQRKQQQQHNLPDMDKDVAPNRRPLKKRRIVVSIIDYDNDHITDNDNPLDATITKTKTKTKTIKKTKTKTKTKAKTKTKRKIPVVKRKKTGAIAPSSSSSSSSSSSLSSPTVTKKTVTWNDREGNVIHSQQYPKLYVPYYDEMEGWYTVSLFLSLSLSLSLISRINHEVIVFACMIHHRSRRSRMPLDFADTYHFLFLALE